MIVMFGRDLCKGRAIGSRKGKVEEILGDVGLVWELVTLARYTSDPTLAP